MWVKLSGLDVLGIEAPKFPYPDIGPFARELAKHAPERLIWGSDWPHLHMKERMMPNDGDLLDLLADWVPDGKTRDRILADNPARLYGLPARGQA